MNQLETASSQEKTASINQALKVLNEAAETSSDEIRTMVEKDFLKFKHLLAEIKPSMSEALSGLQQTTNESFGQAKKSVNHAAHTHPWLFVGVAIAIASLTGFIFANKIRR